MTDLDEKLAYLLDDQSGGDDVGAIDEAIADVNLQYRVRRYRMIGEVMRHEVPWVIDTDFHNRVMQQVGQQAGDQSAATGVPGEASALPPARGSWLDRIGLKPLAGMALAATVAAVTVSLWQPPAGGEGDGKIVTAEEKKIEQLAGQSIAGTGALPASTGGMRWVVERDSPGLQQKLNAYLVNHTEYSNSVQGLIPQARVAGFDARQ